MLESHNLTPITLKAKEGLALINGTQLITSIGAEALERAGNVARQADVVASLTLEVLKGTSRAFDSGNVCLDLKRKNGNALNDVHLWLFGSADELGSSTLLSFP